MIQFENNQAGCDNIEGRGNIISNLSAKTENKCMLHPRQPPTTLNTTAYILRVYPEPLFTQTRYYSVLHAYIHRHKTIQLHAAKLKTKFN